METAIDPIVAQETQADTVVSADTIVAQVAVVEEPPKAATTWRVIGKSVRGASHDKSGLPNQDAIGWWPSAGTNPPLALAVADGHGSAGYFRSDVGAQLAVKVAVSELEKLLAMESANPNGTTLSTIKRVAEENLPQVIVREWRRLVMEHLEQNPFTDETWEQLPSKDSSGTSIRAAREADPLLAYGATLMCVGVASTFIVYVQLGDGNILVVSETKDVSEPIPEDSRLMGNETTSLCSDSVGRDFRVVFQPIVATPPVLIMVTTDGYINSIDEQNKGKANFYSVAKEYLQRIRDQGLDLVERSLEQILNATSKQGSGDDITLGMIRRFESKDIDTITRNIWEHDKAIGTKLDRAEHEQFAQSQLAAYTTLQTSTQQAIDKSVEDMQAALGKATEEMHAGVIETTQEVQSRLEVIGTEVQTQHAELENKITELESKLNDYEKLRTEMSNFIRGHSRQRTILMIAATLSLLVAVVTLVFMLLR